MSFCLTCMYGSMENSVIFGGTKRYIDQMYPDYFCLASLIYN